MFYLSLEIQKKNKNYLFKSIKITEIRENVNILMNHIFRYLPKEFMFLSKHSKQKLGCSIKSLFVIA